MKWVVLCTDHRQGENFVVGTFDSRAEAYVWGMKDAVSKAKEWGMEEELSSDDEYSVMITEPDGDWVYEWAVMIVNNWRDDE